MSLKYYTGIIAVFLILLCISPNRPDAAEQVYLVTEVHDADTVSIKVKSLAGFPLKTERLRLIGIDAPELRQEPWGRRAKRAFKKMLAETDWVVRVEFDVEQRDQYGRLLGYLWKKDGRMINERLLEEGFAVLYTVPPNVKYAERFVQAQKRAQALGKGIWGRDGLSESPSEWRKAHPRSREQ
jgi:micrococcal nuclease